MGEIGKRLQRTAGAVDNKLYTLKLKKNASHSNTQNDASESSDYLAYTSVSYASSEHPEIAGNFWCCSCVHDVDFDQLHLCTKCKKALSHKSCVSVLGGQCPRCKYYKHWKEEKNEDREWTE